jgi:hypothetical protein
MAELLEEFGGRWQITYAQYEDGWQLSAVPRPADSAVLPLACRTPALMGACGRESEMAETGRRLLATAREQARENGGEQT